MPLVRIDLACTTPSDRVAHAADAVHRALVDTFDVPAEDRFQVISRRAADEIVCSPGFLGIAHSDRALFVQIACAPGRTVEQKKALFRGIAGGVADGGHFKADDVIVNLVESGRENWSFGRGLASFA